MTLQSPDAAQIPAVDLTAILLGGPKLDDEDFELFAEIEAARKTQSGRLRRWPA